MGIPSSGPDDVKVFAPAKWTRATYVLTNIVNDTVWSGDVYIGDNIEIKAGANVTVQGGTNVIFNSSGSNTGYMITIRGGLQAIGSSSQRIVFKSGNIKTGDRENSDFFNQIFFDTQAYPPVFKYCDFKYGDKCIYSKVDVVVEYCSFHEYNANGIECDSGATLTGKYLSFSTNKTSACNAIYCDSSSIVTLNSIRCNGVYHGLKFSGITDVVVTGFSGHTYGKDGKMISPSLCDNLTLEDCTLDSPNSGSSGDIPYIIYANDIKTTVIDGLDGTFKSGIMVKFTDSGTITASYMTLTGEETANGFYAECDSLKIDNSTINIAGGYPLIVDDVYEHDLTLVFLDNLDIVGLGDEDIGLQVTDAVSVILTDVSIETSSKPCLAIKNEDQNTGGSSVIESLYFETVQASDTLFQLGGDSDFEIYDVTGISEYAATFMDVTTEGSVDAWDITFNCSTESVGILDATLGENSYGEVDLQGEFTMGVNFSAGGKSLDGLTVDLHQDGTGVACHNLNMDSQKPKYVYLENIDIYGGEYGIYCVGEHDAIRMEVDIINVTIEQCYECISLYDVDAYVSDIILENPTEDSWVGVLIRSDADVEMTRATIFDYYYGIGVESGSSLDCYMVEISDAYYGVSTFDTTEVTLSDMNIINYYNVGIDSTDYYEVENVWVGHPSPYIYGYSYEDDGVLDATYEITLDEYIEGPVDISGMEQRPYLVMRYVNGEQDPFYSEYLGGNVTFRLWAGDGDADDTLEELSCSLYDEYAVEIDWDYADVSGDVNHLYYSTEYDTTEFDDYTYVYFEAYAEVKDGESVGWYWEFETFQPGDWGDDDDDYYDYYDWGWDGWGDGDAPDEMEKAWKIDLDEDYDYNTLDAEDDVDWYYFTATGLQGFMVEITGAHNATVSVYDSDQEEVGDKSNFDRIVIVKEPDDGTYFVKVEGTSKTNYEMVVSTNVIMIDDDTGDDDDDDDGKKGIFGQDVFWLILEVGIGLVIILLMAGVGLFFATRKRRRISQKMKEINRTNDEYKGIPPKAITELEYLHRKYEEEFTNGKIDENQYILLDRKIKDHIESFKEEEAKEREAEIEQKTELPPEIKEEMKEAVADGQVTPEEAEKLIEDVEASDLPEDQKEEVKEMVVEWSEEDKQMPPPPPPPD